MVNVSFTWGIAREQVNFSRPTSYITHYDGLKWDIDVNAKNIIQNSDNSFTLSIIYPITLI